MKLNLKINLKICDVNSPTKIKRVIFFLVKYYNKLYPNAFVIKNKSSFVCIF